jgi:two-component system, NtrC family, nitrogen regulation sensor histidine kinase NtrY
MAPTFPRRLLALFGRRRSRLLLIGCILLALLGCSQLVRIILVGHLERDWQDIQESRAKADVAIAVQEFNELQRSAQRVAGDLGQQRDILDFLTGMRNDRRALFAAVRRIAEANECGIDIFDAEGEMVGWGGSGGPAARDEMHNALNGQCTSAVARTAVSSQLVVTAPIQHHAKVFGAAVVRQTLELDYPLSNRYMAYVGLADRLSEKLGTTVEFDFGGQNGGRKDGRWLAASLFGIDNRGLGAVSVMRPMRSSTIESTLSSFSTIDTVLFILFCLVVLYPVVRWLLQHRQTLSGAIGLIFCLWCTRYLLLVLGFPGLLITQGIFNPALFASEFGGGLARSVGDLLLTVLTFAASLAGLARVTAVPLRQSRGANEFHVLLVRFLGSAVVAFLLFWILRGFGAVVATAVFDSTLNYGDPAIILPTFPMSVMILSLGTLSVCMLAVGVRVTEHLLEWLGPGIAGMLRVALLYMGASVLFGTHQDEPLMSTPYRLFCSAAFIGIALWHIRAGSGQVSRKWGRLGFTYAGAAVCLLVPLLQRNVDSQMQHRIEGFALELVRPVDGWLKVVVEDGLRRLKDVVVTEVGRGDQDSPKDTPLRAWAQSTACREGYSARFAILDSTGAEQARFAIGNQSFLAAQFADALPLDTAGMVRIKSIGDGISAVRVYGGTSVLHDANGRRAGFGRVVVAAGEQSLFRGDNPAVLRGSAGDPIESFYRSITVSEYRDGLLVRTSNTAIPYTQVLSDEIRTSLNHPGTPSVWSAEHISGAEFESYAIKRGNDSHDVIVLSVAHQRMLLLLVGLVKVPLVFLIALLAGAGGYTLLPWGQHRHYRFTFRDKLLGAMLLTAFLPLGALLIYGRYSVHQRAMETLSTRLEEETASIAEEIAGIGEYSDVSSDLVLRPDRVELIASNVGTDFNLYVGSDLRVSSRPELYTTGFLDSRVDGKAYAAVVLEGRRFDLESEHVGLYQYEVGYRPVLDAAGGVIGIVGVPTLYRQEEVEREVSEQNAVLIGVYAVVLLAIVLAITVLANRIAAPVQGLTALTRDIARGELDISQRLPKAEGEIGELVQSFGTMARDLRRSRDELVHVERELAWREMARQIAHEIKNPLTPMKLSIQHLRQTYRDGAPDFDAILEKVTRTVIEQIDALGRIASEFSNFARMPRRRIEACEVEEIVQEAAQLFRQDTQVVFHVHADENIPTVQADRDELRRAFINIIRNGIQAMTGKGKIDVTLAKTGTGVRVAIRDYGSGIADEVRPKLFQPNFSTKTDGMGLGLAIVKKTMDDLGARIEIQSTPGAGTTVLLDIPATERSGPP